MPAPGVEAWVAGMQAAGISLCLVSNNHPPGRTIRRAAGAGLCL
ncbi:MAG: hypothetical protein ACLT3Y_01715 [Ruminococcus callidus]